MEASGFIKAGFVFEEFSPFKEQTNNTKAKTKAGMCRLQQTTTGDCSAYHTIDIPIIFHHAKLRCEQDCKMDSLNS